MNVVQVLNTNGAARRLGCTRTWIHKLVSAGKLKGYVYDKYGGVRENKAEQKNPWPGLYFFFEDINQYQVNMLRRLRGGQGGASLYSSKKGASPGLSSF